MPEARWNPEAAKASDCEGSKSFCAVARRYYEAQHPLEAPLIDVYSEAETHRLRCGRVAPRAFCRWQLPNPGSIWEKPNGQGATALPAHFCSEFFSFCLQYGDQGS
jgi:hypothetical protein